MKKGIIALICMVITLVFIIIALIGPWHGGSGTSKGTGMDSKTEQSVTLFSTTFKSEGVITADETIDHSDARKTATDTGVYDLFDMILYITIIALIIAILAIIGILGIVLNFGNPKTMKMLGSIFSVLTLIFVFIAVFYFMTAYPDEAKLTTPDGKDAGFWDSDSGEITEGPISYEYKYSIGPGYAWYLMLIGGIIALIASIIVFMEKPGAPMATIPPQQPRPPQ